MGLAHGAWCVGCFWALMTALFALGVMSIGWMAFVAALIAIEKTAPLEDAREPGIAVLLLVLGLGVACAPASTSPDSRKDHEETMQGMPSAGAPPHDSRSASAMPHSERR